jgi:hypothetical protein
MGSVISEKRLNEARQKRNLKRLQPVLLIDAENDTFIFPKHQQEAMARDLGMPLPPRGFLIDEDDEIKFPPPTVPLLPSA